MDAVPEIRVAQDGGIVGGVDRSRRRQITLLEQEVWDRLMRDLGGNASASARRANVAISGIRLAHTRGRVLRVGEARIEIDGELTPCERMDEVLPGLQAAMRPNWGGGAFGRILGDATIRAGDSVEWENP
jgi:MOSC domain-containing protein YiiM